jgi:diketogulonate reductase-like aldo/keto reductase
LEGEVKVDNKVSFQETWKAMEELVTKGLTKNIGCANMTKPMFETVVKNAEIKPANLQIECHPHKTEVDLVNYCLDQGISVTAYSSLGGTNYMSMEK